MYGVPNILMAPSVVFLRCFILSQSNDSTIMEHNGSRVLGENGQQIEPGFRRQHLNEPVMKQQKENTVISVLFQHILLY